jgi:chromosome segregation ATPase
MSNLDMGVAAGAALAGLIALLWLRSLLKRKLTGKADGAGRAPANGADAPLIERRVSAVERAQAEIVGRLDDMAEAGAPEERMQAMASSLVGLIQDKNAAMEMALAGLDQLRARLGTLEKIGDMAEACALFDGLTERLEALEAGRKQAEAAFGTRLAALAERLEGDGGPAAALGAKLARLHEQKEAGLAAMMARIEPLETRLGRIETGMKALPAEAAERVEGRIGAIARLQSDVQAEIAALRARADSATAPFAEISEQLTRLYAQKDSTTEAMLARLAPLEAKLAELETGLREADPRAALDRFAERLAASEAAHGADTARLTGEIETLRSAENPFAEISEQLTRLYAQKDAVVEAMLARLAPVEAKLVEMETAVAAKDPQAAIDRFAERLVASEARLTGEIETLRSAENPFAEISEQLTRLYAQKDGTVAAMLARLAPLEAKLAGIETEMGARDPQAAIAGLAERIERLQDGQGDLAERLAAASAAAEEPYGALSERVAELAARAEAASEEIAGRIAPLAERLEALETRGIEDEDAARAEAEEIAEQLIAMREAAERTALFADRIAMLETSLPRLTMAQSLMMEALERRSADGTEPAAEAPAAPTEAAEAAPAAETASAETEAEAGEEIDDIWNIPRVVSMHQG